MKDAVPALPETPARATSAETTTRIARSALMLATLAFLGLALTVGWQLAIAAVYGTSAELDAFWIGAAIPVSIAGVFHLGVLTLLFVVVFHMPQGSGGRAEKDRLASSVFNAVAIGTAAVALLLAATAPTLVRWMGPGIAPEYLPVATSTLRWLTLLLVVSAPLGAMAGILNAFERFAPFAWSRVLGLALQIVVLFALVRTLGVDALTASLLAGTVAMVIACWPTFRKTGFQWSPAIAFRGDEARSVLRMMIALVLLGLLSRGNQVVGRYFASLLGDGAVSALEYGWRFEIPVSQILAFSIALPSFAMMALHAGSARMDEFRETVAASVRLTAILVAPVILFLVVMREPLTVLWFQRGAFSPEAAATVASLIPYLGVMFICLGLGPVMVFGMLTLNRKAALVGILTGEVVLNAALCWPLSKSMGVRGVALATTSAMLVSNAALWTIFVRHVGGFSGASIGARALRTALVCAISALALAAGHHLLWGAVAIDGTLAILFGCAALGFPFLALYAVLLHAAGLIHVHFEGLKPVVRFPGRCRDVTIDISVIIASYNTCDLLEQNLRSIFENPPQCGFEVVVSDDASTDDSADMVRAKFPQAVLRVNPQNSGYARTNNWAIAMARGRYVYLLNCDARVEPGALDTLVAFMDAHPKAGAAGTLIYNENGSVQASVKALPSLRSAFVGKRSWIYRFFPDSSLVANELLVTDATAETPPFQAGYVSSASVILPRDVVKRVGDWDPRLWWFIDADYCKRVHDLGYEVWCVPQAQIVHLDHKGGTVRGRKRRFWAIYKFHQGAWIYWRQYSGYALLHPATLFAGAALLGRAGLSFGIQIAKEIAGREDRY